MKSKSILCSVALVAALGVNVPASAGERSFTYTVEHPVYGTIGSYTDEFRDDAKGLRVDSRLRVAVKVLGITLYRENTDRTEVWTGGRLQSVLNVTDRNGKRLEVRGEAKPDGFVITAGTDTKKGPRDISPADAWVLKQLGKAVVFSPRSGRIDNVVVTGGDAETLSVQGRSVAVRHFHVHTDTQRDKWEVWLDPDGVPVKFRSLEEGHTIDFNLVAAAKQAASERPLRPDPRPVG